MSDVSSTSSTSASSTGNASTQRGEPRGGPGEPVLQLLHLPDVADDAACRTRIPPSPMDTNAFTQQLVAMTGVQQQLLTNELLAADGDQQLGFGGQLGQPDRPERHRHHQSSATLVRRLGDLEYTTIFRRRRLKPTATIIQFRRNGGLERAAQQPRPPGNDELQLERSDPDRHATAGRRHLFPRPSPPPIPPAR